MPLCLLPPVAIESRALTPDVRARISYYMDEIRAQDTLAPGVSDVADVIRGNELYADTVF